MEVDRRRCGPVRFLCHASARRVERTKKSALERRSNNGRPNESGDLTVSAGRKGFQLTVIFELCFENENSRANVGCAAQPIKCRCWPDWGKNGRITPYTCMANSDKYRFDELRSEQWMATGAGSGVASHGY